MRPTGSAEEGFTLIETLVAIALFSVLAAAFYQVMFAGVRASDTTRNVVRISEEARFGLNRMVRDTREARRITLATPTSYTVEVDFDGDNTIEPADKEVETFAYDPAQAAITITAGPTTEVLVRGVEGLAGKDMFSFSSSDLIFDHDPVDGIATWEEVDLPPPGVTGGNRNDDLDVGEYPYLTNVNYAFVVDVEDRETAFYAEAQLRNRR